MAEGLWVLFSLSIDVLLLIKQTEKAYTFYFSFFYHVVSVVDKLCFGAQIAHQTTMIDQKGADQAKLGIILRTCTLLFPPWYTSLTHITESKHTIN